MRRPPAEGSTRTSEAGAEEPTGGPDRTGDLGVASGAAAGSLAVAASASGATTDDHEPAEQRPDLQAVPDRDDEPEPDKAPADSATETETETEPEPERQAASAVPLEEPQEQPFERDGRWWFRRGDELLVYNELTQQWDPAPGDRPGAEEPVAAIDPDPEPASASSSTTREEAETGFQSVESATGMTVGDTGLESSTGDESASGSEDEGVESREESPGEPEAEGEADDAITPPPEDQGFWKCASCGAVNGSTATTCRMCFSPRP